MKKIVAVSFLVALMLTLGWAGNKKFVNPGGKYKNDQENTVYLLLPLKPGETFKNTSGKTFRVLKSPKDFLEFSKQLEIDFMIETAGSKIDKLNKLQRGLESEQAKLDSIKSKKE